jgi:hypothetical protein
LFFHFSVPDTDLDTDPVYISDHVPIRKGKKFWTQPNQVRIHNMGGNYVNGRYCRFPATESWSKFFLIQGSDHIPAFSRYPSARLGAFSSVPDMMTVTLEGNI